MIHSRRSWFVFGFDSFAFFRTEAANGASATFRATKRACCVIWSPMSSVRPFLYVKSGCPWCDEAEAYLHDHGLAYGKVDVHSDPTAWEEMKRLSGQTKAPTMRWGDEIWPTSARTSSTPFCASARSSSRPAR